MHEFSLTQNLLEMALKRANRRKIVNVHLLIGPFSEEREETIRFFWRDLAKGTLGDGAQIYFQYRNVEVRCLGCGGVVDVEGDKSNCRYCQSGVWDATGEEEVRLQGIDVE